MINAILFCLIVGVAWWIGYYMGIVSEQDRPLTLRGSHSRHFAARPTQGRQPMKEAVRELARLNAQAKREKGMPKG